MPAGICTVDNKASIPSSEAFIGTPITGLTVAAGIPVATVAIGKAGAKNAAYLAVQMMSLADPQLSQKLRDERAANADVIYAKDAALQEKLKG